MSKQILVVDDSPSMRQMIQFTLSEDGYVIVEAENGKAALAVMGDATDLVITDINMPGMTGIELITALRAQSAFKFKPIIVLTTESDAAMQSAGKAAGATAWLIKPFTPEKLKETVKRVIG